MIPAITNFATNSILTNISQSTTASLLTETTMKAIGRPGFILIDNNIDQKTKRYAAMKEFLYQFTCLAVYMALVVPVFKNGAFKLAKNKIFKNEACFQKFKNVKEYTNYHKLADKDFDSRIASLNKGDVSKKDILSDELENYLRTTKTPEKYPLIKGAVELGSLIGSVFGLAILAPQVSHAIVHPVMKMLGFEKANKKEEIEKALTVKLQVPPEQIKSGDTFKKEEVQKK